MEELTNIWNAEDEFNEEQLLNYINGNATANEIYSVEKQMADSAFINDAVEGLQNFAGKDINSYVKDLNKTLKNHLSKGKAVKEKRKIKGLEWAVIAVLLVLALIAVAYIVLKLQGTN